MSFKHITSRDNPIFKQLKKLSENARERRSEGKTLLDGVHLIESYMAIFGDPDVLIIPEGRSTVEATSLIQALEHISTVMLPTLMFAELTPVTNATGILALVKIPQLPLPETIDFALLLEDIQDPGNLGSILRTAAGAGVDAVYLSLGSTDVWSPKALRGGQGAQFILPIIERADLLTELQSFQGNSYATAMEGESLYAQDLTLATAFVIGNEGTGLSKQVMAATSKRITIPMAINQFGSIESLNAGAATAICLFERTRQVQLNG
ncbi:MAG TPA: RNA methyltransferase [Methylotenera sp.]|nr:RNA methyltransferase [Methylotenera sp.]